MRFSKVFGIDLPRTGTTSLNIALNQLGIASKHFPFELYTNKNKSLLNQYTGFVDSPIPFMYKELDNLYPQSGFILTTRPIDGWLKSMKWLLSEGRCIWEWKPEYDEFHEKFFGASTFKHEIYESFYYSFHSQVFEYFKGRDDFLVLDINVGYGYKELCNFLDVPVVDMQYPRGNESRQARWLQHLAYRTGQDGKPIGKAMRRLDHYFQRIQNLIVKY